jgi:hypothetical protein
MKKLKFVAVLVITFVLIVFSFYVVKSIRISEINCRSQYGECSIVVKERLESVKNCDYFSCKKQIDSLMTDAFIVDAYNYQLKLPLKIEVSIVEKKPKYSIKSIEENAAIQIDARGLVLDVRDTSVLPGFLTENKLAEPGHKITDEEFFALQLVYGVSKIQEIERAYWQNNSLSVDLKDGKSILFPIDGDRDFLLGALALILNELKKESAETEVLGIEVIDLRYKNPVLR